MIHTHTDESSERLAEVLITRLSTVGKNGMTIPLIGLSVPSRWHLSATGVNDWQAAFPGQDIG
jgi:hypothetical protein